MQQLGDRIAELLKVCGYTQKELAQMCGVTEAAMSRYINNEREPKIDVIANIATALNTTIEFLITGNEDAETFENVYHLVARGANKMSLEEKVKLVNLLLKD